MRVDWQTQCPGCGTQLAEDFCEGLSDSIVCPWCGSVCETDCASRYDELKQYLDKAIDELESNVNTKAPV